VAQPVEVGSVDQTDALVDGGPYLISDKFGGLREPSGAFLGTDCRPATMKNFLGYSLQRLGTESSAERGSSDSDVDVGGR